jgi:hypothetical protein
MEYRSSNIGAEKELHNYASLEWGTWQSKGSVWGNKGNGKHSLEGAYFHHDDCAIAPHALCRRKGVECAKEESFYPAIATF